MSTLRIAARDAILLSSVGALALAVSGTARADEIATVPNAALPGDIVVTGQRTAELRGLQIKQRAVQEVETLVADDVGKLPDQNVAEAVKRLPGISVLNDQGEGRYVVVRGINPDLVNVTVNSQTQPAPEPTGRQVKLDDIPSAMIGAVTITKSLTPDQDPNAIGGSIDIRTLSAFDRTRPFFASGRFEVGEYKLNKKDPKEVDAQIGGRFGANQEFGAVASISYSKRPIESENFQGGSTWDAQGRPDQFGLRDYNLVRERTGVVLNLDYRPSDAVSLFLRGTYSKFTDHEVRDQERADSIVYTGTTSGTYVGRPSMLVRVRNEDDRTKSVSGGGTFKLGGGMQLDANASFASAVKDDPLRSEYNFRGSATGAKSVSGTFDVSSSPYLFSFSPAFVPANYALNSVNYDVRHAQEDVWQARTDLTIPVAFGDESTIKLGVKYLDRHKTNDRNYQQYGLATGQTFTAAAGAYTGDTSFYGNAYVFGPRLDYGTLQAYVAQNPAVLAQSASNRTSTINNSLAVDYDVTERIWAGYAMATLRFGKLTVIPGVRLEHTEDSALAQLITATSSPNQPYNLFNSKSYSNLLPGLNLKYDASERLVLRAAVTTAIGRPNYAVLAPFVQVDTTTSPVTVTKGNPDLKPYKALNLDAAVEYYLPRKGVISAGVFYKHLDDPIYNTGALVTNGTFAGQTFATAQVVQSINAGSAEVYGVELNLVYPFDFLPAPLDGLGFSGNVTLIGGEGKDWSGRTGNIPLLNQSKRIGTAQLTYEKYGVSARLAWSYRSPYLDTLGGSAALDQWTDSNGQLDARIAYNLAPEFEVYAVGTNLTDAAWRRYQGIKSQLLERERYGQSYRVGFQIKF